MIKNIINFIPYLIYKRIALYVLNKNKGAKIVAITGSIGKTSTKNIIDIILKESNFNVRSSFKSFNTKEGVIFTILGIHSYYQIFKLIKSIFLSTKIDFFVFEIGVDKKGDVDLILEIIEPDIVLLTKFSNNPVHSINFFSKKELYEEKLKLASAAKEILILNNEDRIQVNYSRQSNKKILFYNSANYVRLSDYNTHYNEECFPVGIDLEIEIKNKKEFLFIPGVIGIGESKAAVAGVAFAIYINLKIERIRMIYANKKVSKARMRILKGINGSILIDDSYNSSIEPALNSIRSIHLVKVNGQRMAVLGDFKELADLKEAYSQLQDAIEVYLDKVFLIGEDINKNIEDLKNTQVIRLKNINEIDLIKKEINAGDIVLVKGARVNQFDKIIDKIRII